MPARMSDDREFPPQQTAYPGDTGELAREPHDEMRGYEGRGLLQGKAAGGAAGV
jgi:hypothetical protein